MSIGRTKPTMEGRVGPTQFPELNELLTDLVERVEAILGDNFVGAYLQGSFAIGDADIHSDCDFFVVTRHKVTTEQEVGIRELHREIHARPGHWAHHLEGSYAPAGQLRTLTSPTDEWLFLDHGQHEMQWSVHCNNPVARW